MSLKKPKTSAQAKAIAAKKTKNVGKNLSPDKPVVAYRPMPPVEHQFKKGNNANPLGAGAHNQELKALKKITNETVQGIIDIALNGTLAELVAVAEDKRSTALQVGIATSLANAIKKGDFNTLGAIITRLTGEAPKRIDVTTDGKSLNAPVTKVLLSIPANGRTREENDVKRAAVKEASKEEARKQAVKDKHK